MTGIKLLYVGVLLCMLTVVSWASVNESILAIPSVVTRDPWFIATLFDCYFAFLAFYLWVCYREKGVAVKIFWFFAIAGLGNIAMSIYVLIALFKIKPGEDIAALFARAS